MKPKPNKDKLLLTRGQTEYLLGYVYGYMCHKFGQKLDMDELHQVVDQGYSLMADEGFVSLEEQMKLELEALFEEFEQD